MRRILLVLAVAFVASLVLAPVGWAFGTKDVIQMYRDGIPDSLIMQKIEYSGTIFHLSASDMRDLKRAGVPDEIVSAMLATEERADGDGSYYGPSGPYYGPYHRPYYPSYPYYYPYYPRVVIGFGFYGYHRPSFHHYYGHGFHNYYGHRAHGGFAHGGRGTRRFR